MGTPCAWLTGHKRNFKDYIKRNSRGSIDFNAALYMFRHTFASIQADSTALDKVAMLLGDSITTMDMYQNLTNKTKSAVCENSAKFLEDITGKRKKINIETRYCKRFPDIKNFKEPLAKKAALMYNLLRKVYRTRVPMCPQ